MIFRSTICVDNMEAYCEAVCLLENWCCLICADLINDRGHSETSPELASSRVAGLNLRQ